jgi:serine protease Do
MNHPTRRRICMSAVAACASVLIAVLAVLAPSNLVASGSLADVIGGVQPKIVKIHGAGGFEGLEAYQSGFLVSPVGHIVTVWSYVLDSDTVTATLDDGRRFKTELIGADPQLDLAVLKIDSTDLRHFELSKGAEGETGDRVLALSNLYGVASGNEAASVLHGTIAVKTKLDARRGVYKTPYKGDVYVLDAMTNNPGAAGGALIDRQGRLLAMLGKELRNARNNTWLNYAIPIAELKPSIAAIAEGRQQPHRDSQATVPEQPLDLDMLGIVMIPEVLARTPPFIDRIVPDSPAAQAGLRPDDMVLLVDNQLVGSCRELAELIRYVDRADSIRLSLMRDTDLIEVTLRAPALP